MRVERSLQLEISRLKTELEAAEARAVQAERLARDLAARLGLIGLEVAASGSQEPRLPPKGDE